MLHLALCTLLLAAPEEPKISYVKSVQVDPDYRPRLTHEEIERALAPRPRPRRVVQVHRVYVERERRHYRARRWHVALDIGLWGAWWWGWHHWHHHR